MPKLPQNFGWSALAFGLTFGSYLALFIIFKWYSIDLVSIGTALLVALGYAAAGFGLRQLFKRKNKAVAQGTMYGGCAAGVLLGVAFICGVLLIIGTCGGLFLQR